MTNITIIGDSFAAPHIEFDQAWYYQLAQDHAVTNLAQAGVGQYKIRQQAEMIKPCDVIICVVTSAYRVHAQHNPFYTNKDHRHYNADLIYTDVESRLPDERAKHLTYYFREVWDPTHAVYVHNLILKDTKQICNQRAAKFIPVTFFKSTQEEWDFDGNIINLHHVAQKHPGSYNHMNQQGHNQVYEALDIRI